LSVNRAGSILGEWGVCINGTVQSGGDGVGVGLPVSIVAIPAVGADVEPFEPQPASATAATKAMMIVRIAVTSIDGFAASIGRPS
jgi:hypothetical protein